MRRAMKTIDMAEATAPLSRYARRAASSPVVLTRKGKPVAALFAVGNADMETLSLSTNPEFMRLIERSRKRHAKEADLLRAAQVGSNPHCMNKAFPNPVTDYERFVLN